jgi:putative ABC transport system substrate-binding protein
MPVVQRVGVLVNPMNPIHVLRNKENEPTFRSLGMQPIYIEVTAADQLDNAIRDISQRRGQALVVLSDTLFLSNSNQIMRAALRYALPTAVEGPDMLEAGGLISYAVSVPEQRRRVAALIDKILRGAKPADLPIEQATQFDLGVNLKTARALGITVPQSMRLRANQLID